MILTLLYLKQKIIYEWSKRWSLGGRKNYTIERPFPNSETKWLQAATKRTGESMFYSSRAQTFPTLMNRN